MVGNTDWDRLADAVCDAATLLVMPCSADKAVGGRARVARDASVLDWLPDDLAGELVSARRRLVPSAAVDERAVMPALDRYTGTLYQALDDHAQTELRMRPTLVVSAAYGLVEGLEPVGCYERLLRLRDWPAQLLPRTVAAYARATEVAAVVGFAGASSPYAQVLRGVAWPEVVDSAWLVSPYDVGGAAMVKTPRALGEALTAGLDGRLDPDWRSSHGVPVAAERLR